MRGRKFSTDVIGWYPDVGVERRGASGFWKGELAPCRLLMAPYVIPELGEGKAND